MHISAVIFFQYVGVLMYKRIQVTGKFWDLKWIDVDQGFQLTWKKKENKINNKLLLKWTIEFLNFITDDSLAHSFSSV